VSSNRTRIHCQNRDVGNARVVLRYRMLRPKQPITPSNELIRSQVADTIQIRIEANLRDRLRWCSLKVLGGST